MAVKKKRILLVCRQAPYGSSLPRESIELALAAAVFDQNLALIFVGDGVLQLQSEQNSKAINQKSQQKILSALSMYGVDELYVDNEALIERALTLDDLSIAATSLTNKKISELLSTADVVFNF